MKKLRIFYQKFLAVFQCFIEIPNDLFSIALYDGISYCLTDAGSYPPLALSRSDFEAVAQSGEFIAQELNVIAEFYVFRIWQATTSASRTNPPPLLYKPTFDIPARFTSVKNVS